MSLITVGSEVEGMLDVYCELCHKSVGLMTPQEIGELACAGVRVWCFDCDFACADALPSQLVMGDDAYLVGMSGQLFLAVWVNDGDTRYNDDLAFRAIPYWLRSYGVQEVLRITEQSLSSSTYQHKIGASGEVQL